AALELKVTPQITAQGSIIMDLDLKNDIADFTEATKVGGIPIINTESAKTTVLINDGGTIVIGGMYKLVTSSNSTGVPILSKIPFLGSLFRNSSKKMQQQELLIFLTPRIIK
ncbi:MAG TPA: type IV pilus secretin PilQ, partial [Candidatus Aminicenantes bacterium]|nr:type IV pilus secretin PilQ [Candidatus Aminicenantes bacterium]